MAKGKGPKKPKKSASSSSRPAPETEAVAATSEAASPVGSLPRKKREVPAHIKAAADRAEAKGKGKPLAPAVEIDPVIVRAPGAAAAEAAGPGPDVRAALDRIVTLPPEEEDVEPRLGRRSSYKPEYADITRQLCEQGFTDDELADFFSISERQLYRWRNQHIDFRQALVVGKKEADDRVLRSLYQRAVGYEQTIEQIHTTKDGIVTRIPVREKIKGDLGAQKLWATNRMGWSSSDSPPPQQAKPEATNLTDLARRLSMAFRLIAEQGQKTIDVEGEDVSAAA